MEYSPEEYTKFYIVQALFKLMKQYEYEKISVTDIAAKAGVGRATFYRYFKRKEDILNYYLVRSTKEFVLNQRLYPRCREDYIKIVQSVFDMFKENKEQLALIRRARLEYVYLDYLNANFKRMFENDYSERNEFTPYLYAGMLFNVSMAWLDDDCRESVDELAKTLVDAIYFER